MTRRLRCGASLASPPPRPGGRGAEARASGQAGVEHGADRQWALLAGAAAFGATRWPTARGPRTLRGRVSWCDTEPARCNLEGGRYTTPRGAAVRHGPQETEAQVGIVGARWHCSAVSASSSTDPRTRPDQTFLPARSVRGPAVAPASGYSSDHDAPRQARAACWPSPPSSSCHSCSASAPAALQTNMTGLGEWILGLAALGRVGSPPTKCAERARHVHRLRQSREPV